MNIVASGAAASIPKLAVFAAYEREDTVLTPIVRRTFVPTKELKEAFARLPRIEYRSLRADLDAYVDQDPTPRA